MQWLNLALGVLNAILLFIALGKLSTLTGARDSEIEGQAGKLDRSTERLRGAVHRQERKT
jgi:hypothetical protein